MNKDLKDILEGLLSRISDLGYVDPENIPNIKLYMDQVTTFMESELQETKRYPDDKILTKTMINNYAKNHLLPSPEKKKYTKEHILILTFIYYFKQILTIKDIETLLKPITDNYFNSDGPIDVTEIYQEILDLQKSRISEETDSIRSTYDSVSECFQDAADLTEEELEYLKKFAFVCSLCFDVYVKKQIIESIIDEMTREKE